MISIKKTLKALTHGTQIVASSATSEDLTLTPGEIYDLSIAIAGYSNIKKIVGFTELYPTNASSGSMNVNYIQICGFYLSGNTVRMKLRNPLTSQNIKCKMVATLRVIK